MAHTPPKNVACPSQKRPSEKKKPWTNLQGKLLLRSKYIKCMSPFEHVFYCNTLRDEAFHGMNITYELFLKDGTSIVVDGAENLCFGGGKWTRINGIRGYDQISGKWELLEGKKENGNGRFDFVEGLDRWELREGVKSFKAKKRRGEWFYDANKNKMKGVKLIMVCGDEKCERNSEKSKKRIFKICGKCEKVFYCSRKHQKRAWKVHKYVCSYF